MDVAGERFPDSGVWFCDFQTEAVVADVIGALGVFLDMMSVECDGKCNPY